MRRSETSLKISKCIETFLENKYRNFSHLDNVYGGAYYWNERDIHWALYSHLRDRTNAYSIGSKWRVHAEGTINRPKYFRREKWKGIRRADIVFINHSNLKKWFRKVNDNIDCVYPPYDAMIEIKLIWSGSGRANAEYGIKKDIEKLESCLADGTTKDAFFLLLDGLDRQHLPYFQNSLRNLKNNSSLVIYHWPDSKSPIKNIEEAQWTKY